VTVGLDVGSTTIKCVVVDDGGNIVFNHYERHLSQIVNQTASLLTRVRDTVLKSSNAPVMVSGSAGMGMADRSSLPFIQEVYATRVAARRLIPETDVIIELGGEDAKILYLTHGMDVRMNGSCAGGTGAFIDQMASLLEMPVSELNKLASSAEKIYTVASRCGVFAKSDIQPLLNQGARKKDIAASIFHAVVNQTIAGLSQGRPIKGNIAYLGGPLTFLPQLRETFDQTLKTKGLCPENSLYYVALGSAYCATTEVDIDEAIYRLYQRRSSAPVATLQPLFEKREDYDNFVARHKNNSVKEGKIEEGKTYFLGIDAGSTTVKTTLIDQNGVIVDSTYQTNSGNPVPIIKNILERLYKENKNLKIENSAVTGYGEDIIRKGFSVDEGLVETVAHFSAARHFMHDVEFVIDIGGQDIKCFKIYNGAIDNIFLNEACSSGCGSFLQTFAQALGYDIKEFASLGLFAGHPVDLGSRCTVFMNSSVKQAQKEGYDVEDISAGLSISVVKNAIYKVIRATSAKSLGKKIVVQGGTFLNDAVLRAFEMELNCDVIRPNIAGLMGAYGAALHAMKTSKGSSTIIKPEELEKFTHQVKVATCRLCTNNCRLTINTFSNGKRYLSGNRCERPITNRSNDEKLNIYKWKLNQIEKLGLYVDGPIDEDTIAIPLGLNTYELIFFWKAFFETLGKKIVITEPSNRQLYLDGQATIPSDTVCFPAKLMHGHIQRLIDANAKTIFYPCMTYNLDEKLGSNHFNCPVVAYYPEVIKANVDELASLNFIADHIGLHRKVDFAKKIGPILEPYIGKLKPSLLKKATDVAFKEHYDYQQRLKEEGQNIIDAARIEGKLIVVLAGRPYHIDPEVTHGIDRLISDFGVAVVSEDSLDIKENSYSVNVLDQWTYHSRLYGAAEEVGKQDDMHLVQLVSFGCGLDAVTTDEVRDILEHNDKMYTQIKIDEITNLGAVKIRFRSLLSAIEQQKGSKK
jgi:predicted CoA-substrate-specific enzyme activase